jgi:hypothetical protein
MSNKLKEIKSSEELGTSVSAEVKVCSSNCGGGSTGMSPSEFANHLYSNGFKGNIGTNKNYPGILWIGFKNS